MNANSHLERILHSVVFNFIRRYLEPHRMLNTLISFFLLLILKRFFSRIFSSIENPRTFILCYTLQEIKPERFYKQHDSKTCESGRGTARGAHEGGAGGSFSKWRKKMPPHSPWSDWDENVQRHWKMCVCVGETESWFESESKSERGIHTFVLSNSLYSAPSELGCVWVCVWERGREREREWYWIGGSWKVWRTAERGLRNMEKRERMHNAKRTQKLTDRKEKLFNRKLKERQRKCSQRR